MDTDVFRGR